jgi:hypothetical protein
MFLSLSPGIRQGDTQAVRAAVQVLALKAAINGYKSSEVEVNVSSAPGWNSVLSKDQTIDLFREAVALLIEGGSGSKRWPALPSWKLLPSRLRRPR